jgi:Rrf2 family protein
MKISKKAEYALRATVAMARLPRGEPIPVQTLSTAASVPVKFLEQILLILKRGGIFRSKRGVGGGYQLDKQPSDISLGEILRLIDGAPPMMTCAESVASSTAKPGGRSGTCECGVSGGCGLEGIVAEYLDGKSIQDILVLEQPDDVIAFEI